MYNFDGTTGGNTLYGSLIQATDGKLYGTTLYYGANAQGVIYSFDLSTNIYTVLHNFNVMSGSPLVYKSQLIQANDGKLYGTIEQLDSITSHFGSIYSFDIISNTYTDLFNFDHTNGADPKRGLI